MKYNFIKRKGKEGKEYKIIQIKSGYGFDVVVVKNANDTNCEYWKAGHILKHILDGELILKR